jgi:catechol 2,3-dioxygenase-like lactoylglutathione lyase family enzyme
VDAGGGFVLGLHRAHAHGGSGARGGCGVAFELNQPIDEVVAVLANRGVKFEGSVVEDGAVKRAFFADPDGNALHLVEEKRSS